MRNFNFDISSRSYAPYSNRIEHCHVLGKSGLIYPGVRIENSSFPLTIPAEQAAVCSCLGNRDQPIAIVQNDSEKKVSDFWIQSFDLKWIKRVPENSSLYEPLIDTTENVVDQLKNLSKIAVSDKSGFPVAALLNVSNGFIPGVNIEFEEWNLGLCAERVALSRAVASGYKEFSGMHIYAPNSEYISPCGACRQVLIELMPDQMVDLHHNEDSQSRHFVSHLLPNGFTPNSLKR